MKFIQSLFRSPENPDLRERRIAAMQRVVMSLHVPLSNLDTEPDGKVKFSDEEWLVKQLSLVPIIIKRMADENNVKSECNLVINDLQKRLLQKESEIQELKLEIEKLTGELDTKEQVIIIRDERKRE